MPPKPCKQDQIRNQKDSKKDQKDLYKVGYKPKDMKDSLKATKEGKIVSIMKEEIIQVPFSGEFKTPLADTLSYLISTIHPNEVADTLYKVKSGIKNYKPEEIKPQDVAVWTVITILNEINYQAAEQGKTIIAEGSIEESTAELLRQGGSLSEKDYKDFVNSKVDETVKENEKKADLKKDSKSNAS